MNTERVSTLLTVDNMIKRNQVARQGASARVAPILERECSALARTRTDLMSALTVNEMAVYRQEERRRMEKGFDRMDNPSFRQWRYRGT
jgi:hypothetical protein